jgi:hypothetical protein
MKVIKDTRSLQTIVAQNSRSPDSVYVRFGCDPLTSNGSTWARATPFDECARSSDPEPLIGKPSPEGSCLLMAQDELDVIDVQAAATPNERAPAGP